MTLNFEIILKEISRNNLKSATFVTRVIRYRMYNFKNVKNSHGGVLLLVKLQAETCNFTKSNTLPWVFSLFLNRTNGTKPHKTSQEIFSILSYINRYLHQYNATKSIAEFFTIDTCNQLSILFYVVQS